MSYFIERMKASIDEKAEALEDIYVIVTEALAIEENEVLKEIKARLDKVNMDFEYSIIAARQRRNK